MVQEFEPSNLESFSMYMPIARPLISKESRYQFHYSICEHELMAQNSFSSQKVCYQEAWFYQALLILYKIIDKNNIYALYILLRFEGRTWGAIAYYIYIPKIKLNNDVKLMYTWKDH